MEHIDEVDTTKYCRKPHTTKSTQRFLKSFVGLKYKNKAGITAINFMFLLQ
jgi:hypothetical protein